jgi:hypothetical protein
MRSIEAKPVLTRPSRTHARISILFGAKKRSSTARQDGIQMAELLQRQCRLEEKAIVG